MESAGSSNSAERITAGNQTRNIVGPKGRNEIYLHQNYRFCSYEKGPQGCTWNHILAHRDKGTRRGGRQNRETRLDCIFTPGETLKSTELREDTLLCGRKFLAIRLFHSTIRKTLSSDSPVSKSRRTVDEVGRHDRTPQL